MSTSTSTTEAGHAVTGDALDPATCRRALVVCADPNDLVRLVPQVRALTVVGVPVRLMCLAAGTDGDEARRIVLARALCRAAAALGVEEVRIMEWSDEEFRLASVDALTQDVVSAASGADTLVAVADDGSGPRRTRVVDATRRATWRLDRRVWFYPRSAMPPE